MIDESWYKRPPGGRDRTAASSVVASIENKIRERLSYDKDRWITTRDFLFVTEQMESIPTGVEHYYQLAWNPIDALPAVVWPEQRELIETSRDKSIGLLGQSHS